ncbi:asl2855 [Nostoc sp. PCC 7120 = FACHB-418]|nr:asl2855 [Nostoc sp. PCC 7120 = FACHB-418]
MLLDVSYCIIHPTFAKFLRFYYAFMLFCVLTLVNTKLYLFFYQKSWRSLKDHTSVLQKLDMAYLSFKNFKLKK